MKIRQKVACAHKISEHTVGAVDVLGYGLKKYLTITHKIEWKLVDAITAQCAQCNLL